MAQFKGFTCDSCGQVIDVDHRTKKTIRLEGCVANGEYVEDLCPECVAIPPDVTLKPLRRKRGADSE